MKEKVINKNNTMIVVMLSIGLILPSLLQSLINIEHGNQLIIGTFINAMLFLTGFYIKDTKKILMLSTLPSISNIISGILFSGLTYYAKLMLPFIWIGNLLLVCLSKKLRNSTKLSYGISILAKVSVIYFGFRLVSEIFNFPTTIFNVMSVSMGLVQIYTSCLGFGLFMMIMVIIEKLKN